MRTSRLLGAAALALTIAAPAAAQRPATLDTVASPAASADVAAATATFHRSFGGSSIGTRNRQLLEDALREFGFRPDRLRRADVQAIDRTLAELVPGADRQRYGLNRTQAQAVIYMALVHRRGGGGGGWNDAWDDDDRYPSRGGYPACRDMEVRAYDLDNAVAGTNDWGAGMFLDQDERRRARELTREVQTLALQCGARGVADRSSELLRLLGENLPNRGQVVRRIDAIKQAIRDEDRGGRRR